MEKHVALNYLHIKTEFERMIQNVLRRFLGKTPQQNFFSVLHFKCYNLKGALVFRTTKFN